ncbi:MAG: thioredoxin family protein [Chloroflexi bacterium]|nr:thioredoxin family protein [Chloroflexota bacterium]MCH8200620.1 thioredoxin family protein [Chloroflexota bacterium]
MLLEIYVQDGCFGCQRSFELAERARGAFPEMQVEIVDIGSTDGVYRSKVTATPTYILDGEIISLGNPSPAELEAMLAIRATRATR